MRLRANGERAGALLVAVVAWGCGGSETRLGSDTGTDPYDEDATIDCSELHDTDGDTIADEHEGSADPDDDGVPNDLDPDSDGDTIPDSREAGDPDICTLPVNFDRGIDSSGNPMGDDLPDFLDLDSDDDGLPDYDEANVYGTDPRDEDTDSDGVWDAGEVAYGSDPNDPTSTIDPDDFFVILSHDAPEHEHRPLNFGTDVEVAVMDLSAVAEDVEGDPPGAEHDASVFVKDATPVSAFPDAPLGFTSMDDEHFHGVEPGTQVTFDIDFFNDAVSAGESALVFKARIVVMGNDVARLDERIVIIVVPVS